MSLRVWLPLNGDLHNQGTSEVIITNNGATVNNSGKIGKCYLFDGTNDYMSGAYMATQEMSFCCWVNFPSIKSAHLFDARTSTGVGYQPMYITPSTIQIGASGSGFTNLSYTWTTNTWYHICVTHNNIEGKCYINGILIGTSTTAKGVNMGSCTFTLGSRCNQNNYQNAKINDVRIYDHCLSTAEVKEIAQGLVLHYKLDDDKENQWNYNATIPTNNVYSNPTFESSSGWSHWGPSGSSHSSGQNSDKQYIFNKNYSYSHYISENAGTGKYYLLYQTKASPGGARSLQCILKEENNTPITSSVVWPSLNSRTGGAAANRWTSIKYLGNGFYYCKYENVIQSQQTGTNALFGIGVSPGYKIYVSEMYLENSETCTSIFNNAIIQDSSGYNNNGTIIGDLAISNDTPCYSNSVKFNGSNSTIKVIDNNWVVQGAREITINLWAKSSSWSDAHLFSCTQSGGFNTENGNSGYLRFPVHAYTNSGQTSTTYKYDSKEIQISALSTTDWNMLTFVYDSTGSRTYINGNLHHTYAYTSYGIHFNTSARLFLGCEAATASPTTPYFNGQMSDFRIYCTSLSESDIKSLYQTKMKIDNLQNIHTFEFIESSKESVYKKGITSGHNFYESPSPELTHYDKTIYIEPDGSGWVRIFHHNNPANGLFTSGSNWEKGVYVDADRWFDIYDAVKMADKYELMVKQKTTSSAAEVKYRWIQNVSPLTATYNDVKPTVVTRITTTGYTNGSFGGLWISGNANTHMVIANNNSGNWYGATGSWNAYNGGIPGYPNTTITSGYMDIYLRIYAPAKIINNIGISANKLIER